ncbi:MAG: FkbM family methyltransferase [Candidatus Omnitrophica bacterium]|nr:FkbM family methyltransferase [Candidatus Omnitrophota bacterium]MBU4487481.1 FkbM family methyltransferase [Candidatus Omnitrophota bacterium]MCG2705127.1 FkbM family methyltransferase [Candidatus Omnitrophota bacterium]
MGPLANSKLADFIRRNFLLKSLVRGVYQIFIFPFTRKGVDVNIGGAGKYRLDYIFALRGYDGFGDKHNAGFRKWIDCCRDKKIVFDVGAHIGLYTIPAAKAIRQDGRVYAFEPGAANRKYLMRHFKYNNVSNAIIAPYLVGEESKKEQLFYENKKTDPMNSLHPKKNVWLYKRVYREQVTLDDFVRWNNIEPQVIKIDVEGAEYCVLKGAYEAIKRYSPVIFLSVHPKQLGLFGSSAAEVLELINSLQYTAHNCNGEKVSELDFGEYILSKKTGSIDNG